MKIPRKYWLLDLSTTWHQYVLVLSTKTWAINRCIGKGSKGRWES
jgi:hypothetical protein